MFRGVLHGETVMAGSSDSIRSVYWKNGRKDGKRGYGAEGNVYWFDRLPNNVLMSVVMNHVLL